MIKIFDRYVFAELMKPFLAGVSISVVTLVANAFFFYLKLVNDTNLPWASAMRLFLFQIPAWIVLAFPMGYLFSSLIVVGRMSKDHELTAFQSCGVSLIRCSVTTLGVSVLVSLGALFINETITPRANYQSKMIYIDMATNPKIMPIKERTFFDTKENKKYMYIDSINKETGLFRNIFIFDSKDDAYPKIIKAKKGIRRGDKIVLNEGFLKKYSKQGYVNYELEFKEMEISMDFSSNIRFQTQKDVTDLDYFASKELIEKKESEVQGNPDRLKELNEKKVFHYNKLSLPFATFFVTILSIPIGMLFVKRSLFLGLAICIAIIFVWNISFQLSSALGKTGTLDPLLASWIQNIVFAIAGTPLFIYLSKK